MADKFKSRDEALAATTPEQIIRAYTGGRLEYTDFRKLEVEKALFENQKAFGPGGYMSALYSKFIKELNAGWENVKAGVADSQALNEKFRTGEYTQEDRTKYSTIKEDIVNAGQMLWGLARAANSIPTAFGETTGLSLERIALQNGASPSTAAHLRVAGDMVGNIIPSIATGLAEARVGGAIVGRGMKLYERILASREKQAAIKFGEGAAGATTGEGAIAAMRADQELSGQMVLLKGVEEGTGYEGAIPPKRVPRNTAEYTPPAQPTPQTIEDASKAGQLVLPETPPPGATKAGQTGLPLGAGKEGPGLPISAPSAESKAAAQAMKEGLAADGIESPIVNEAAGGAAKAASAAAEAKPKYIMTERGSVINTETGEIVPKDSVMVSMEREMVDAKAVAPRVWTGVAQRMADNLGIPRDDWGYLMAGWEPHGMAVGDPDAAARAFAQQIAGLTPYQMIYMKQSVSNMLTNESGAMLPDSLAKAFAYSNLANGFRNILLANPASRLRDVLSNTAATGNYVAQRYVGAGLNLVGLGSGETTFSGSNAYARGLVVALNDGFKAFGDAFTAQGLMRGSTRFDRPIEDVAEHMWQNVPTSAVVGIDRFFKTTNRRAFLEAAETERAIKTGTAFNPDNVFLPGRELSLAADAHAEYVTFQNDLGAIGNFLIKASSTPGVEMYYPFMKTSIDLNKYGWNNTPGLQLLSARLWNELKAGGTAADAAQGRLMLSNAFGFYISELAKADLITGTGPADPKARAAWLKTHEPLSIKFGDKWYGLNAVSPLHQVVGLIANITEIMPEFKDDPAVIEKMGLAAMMATYSVMESEGWGKQLTDTTSAIHDALTGKGDTALQQGLKVVVQPALSVLTSGPASMVKNIIDPNVRDAYTVQDYFRAATPVYSLNVPLRTDDYGNPVVPARALGGPWAGPFVPIKGKDIPVEDKVVMEGARVGAKAPAFSRSIGGSPHEFDINDPKEGDHVGVALSLQQEAELKQFYHDYLYDEENGVPALVQNDEYKKNTTLYQKQQFDGLMRDAKTDAEDKILEKYPDLGIKLLQNQARQDLGIYQPNDPRRYDIQRGYAEAISYYEGLQNLTPDEQRNILRFSTPAERPDQ